jgi:hypothetical protein
MSAFPDARQRVAARRKNGFLPASDFDTSDHLSCDRIANHLKYLGKYARFEIGGYFLGPAATTSP